MTDDLTKRSAATSTQPVKRYTSPRLVVYGSLAAITRKVGAHAKADGGFVAGMTRSGK
jgi:hypothetical protein